MLVNIHSLSENISRKLFSWHTGFIVIGARCFQLRRSDATWFIGRSVGQSVGRSLVATKRLYIWVCLSVDPSVRPSDASRQSVVWSVTSYFFDLLGATQAVCEALLGFFNFKIKCDFVSHVCPWVYGFRDSWYVREWTIYVGHKWPCLGSENQIGNQKILQDWSRRWIEIDIPQYA